MDHFAYSNDAAASYAQSAANDVRDGLKRLEALVLAIARASTDPGVVAAVAEYDRPPRGSAMSLAEANQALKAHYGALVGGFLETLDGDNG